MLSKLIDPIVIHTKLSTCGLSSKALEFLYCLSLSCKVIYCVAVDSLLVEYDIQLECFSNCSYILDCFFSSIAQVLTYLC